MTQISVKFAQVTKTSGAGSRASGEVSESINFVSGRNYDILTSIIADVIAIS